MKLSKEQIEWCNEHLSGWKENEDGTVNVRDEVFLDELEIEKLPVSFRTCNSHFTVRSCRKLLTLEGCPNIINGNFDCSGSRSLPSLKGAPKYVQRFTCNGCIKLENLEGSPEIVQGHFVANNCDSLLNLKGITRKIGGSIFLKDCINLESLEGLPDEASGHIYLDGCKKLPGWVIAESDIKKYDLFKIEYDFFASRPKLASAKSLGLF